MAPIRPASWVEDGRERRKGWLDEGIGREKQEDEKQGGVKGGGKWRFTLPRLNYCNFYIGERKHAAAIKASTEPYVTCVNYDDMHTS